MCGTDKVGRAHPKFEALVKPILEKGVREARLRSQQKEDLPPKKSSPPSGGPTRLGIRRSTSARKRGGVSGRSRSRSKAFSTKR